MHFFKPEPACFPVILSLPYQLPRKFLGFHSIVIITKDESVFQIQTEYG